MQGQFGCGMSSAAGLTWRRCWPRSNAGASTRRGSAATSSASPAGISSTHPAGPVRWPRSVGPWRVAGGRRSGRRRDAVVRQGEEHRARRRPGDRTGAGRPGACTRPPRRPSGSAGSGARSTNARTPTPTRTSPVEQRPTLLVVTDDDGIELRIRFDHVHGQLVLAVDRLRSQGHPQRTQDTPLRSTRPTANDPNGAPGVRRGPHRRQAHRRRMASPRPAPLGRTIRRPSSRRGCRPRGSTPPSSSTSASTPSTAPTSPTPR